MTPTLMALTILGMGLITYAIRLSLFLLPERVTLAPWLLRALRYVPAAVLSAIIMPELLLPGGCWTCRWAMTAYWPVSSRYSWPGGRETCF